MTSYNVEFKLSISFTIYTIYIQQRKQGEEAERREKQVQETGSRKEKIFYMHYLEVAFHLK